MAARADQRTRLPGHNAQTTEGHLRESETLGQTQIVYLDLWKVTERCGVRVRCALRLSRPPAHSDGQVLAPRQRSFSVYALRLGGCVAKSQLLPVHKLLPTLGSSFVADHFHFPRLRFDLSINALRFNPEP